VLFATITILANSVNDVANKFFCFDHKDDNSTEEYKATYRTGLIEKKIDEVFYGVGRIHKDLLVLN